jgi:hypothetical protein
MVVKAFKPTHPEPAPAGGVLCNAWRVGRRMVVLVHDLTDEGDGLAHATWWPDLPRKLTEAEWRQYRDGRDRHHQRLANMLGGVVMAVDL